MKTASLFLVFISLCAPSPARAQNGEEKDFSAALIETGVLLEAQGLELKQARQRLRSLYARRAPLEAAYALRRASMEESLLALSILARAPPVPLSQNAQSPAPRARREGALLLKAALARLSQQARALEEQMTSLRSIQNRIHASRRAALFASDSLKRMRRGLAALQAARRKSDPDPQAAILAKRAARALTLPQLSRALGAPDRKGDNQPVIHLPAQGALISAFGALTPYGTRSQGITIHMAQGADILAPLSGNVLFTENFRGYGRVLIIAASGGYHAVLAGLAEISARAGEYIAAGEPVGRMPQQRSVPQNERKDTQLAAPRLYIEIRKDDSPVNPALFLPEQNNKKGE